MRPDQRTKIAADIYEILSEYSDRLTTIKALKEQTYTEILEEIEQYIAEKIG